MTRVVASDGSVFALRLPEAFGTDIRPTEHQGADELVAVAGQGFEARIELGFCPYEQMTRNALGLPMADLPLGEPPASLAFCRGDEFLRLVIEPLPDIDFSTDHFDIIPVAFGRRYADWVWTNMDQFQQCCFEDRGPMHHQGTMVVSDGFGSSQVTGMNAETLVPIWTTDLAALLDDRGDWVGDLSLLFMLNDSGVLITTTGYGFIVALDAKSGEQLWIADLDRQSPGGLRAVDENTIIVTSSILSEGDLTAPTVRLLDIESGAEIWAANADEGTELQWGRPAIINGLVVIAVVPSYHPEPASAPLASVSAFDLETGAKAWTSPLDSSTEAFASFDSIVTDSSRGLLLVTDVDGSMYRLDPATGTRIWASTPGFGPPVGLSPETVTVRVRSQDIELSLETGERVN